MLFHRGMYSGRICPLIVIFNSSSFYSFFLLFSIFQRYINVEELSHSLVLITSDFEVIFMINSSVLNIHYHFTIS